MGSSEQGGAESDACWQDVCQETKLGGVSGDCSTPTSSRKNHRNWYRNRVGAVLPAVPTVALFCRQERLQIRLATSSSGLQPLVPRLQWTEVGHVSLVEDAVLMLLWFFLCACVASGLPSTRISAQHRVARASLFRNVQVNPSYHSSENRCSIVSHVSHFQMKQLQNERAWTMPLKRRSAGRNAVDRNTCG